MESTQDPKKTGTLVRAYYRGGPAPEPVVEEAVVEASPADKSAELLAITLIGSSTAMFAFSILTMYWQQILIAASAPLIGVFLRFSLPPALRALRRIQRWNRLRPTTINHYEDNM